jgi:PRTRC genetic system ThiF family protein
MKIQLNKDSLHARSLLLPVTKSTCLIMIGCGGTGSWLAPHIVRVARLLQEARDQEVSVVFCDHDHVEAKNIFRQNFCEAEIGANKALALAQRYGHAWGIPIAAIDKPFDKSMITRNDLVPSYNDQRITVLVTCVDNNSTRRAVAKMCQNWPIWWVDTGNLKTSGQVSVGRELNNNEPSPLRFPSRTTWLPMPSLQFPDILTGKEESRQADDYSNLSCADLAIVDEQGLSINHAIASASASLLMKMLVTGDLQYHCLHVSMDFGTSLIYNSPRTIRSHFKAQKFKAQKEGYISDEFIGDEIVDENE